MISESYQDYIDDSYQKADSILNKAQTALTTIENKLNK